VVVVVDATFSSHRQSGALKSRKAESSAMLPTDSRWWQRRPTAERVRTKSNGNHFVGDSETSSMTTTTTTRMKMNNNDDHDININKREWKFIEN
jgi:hypothetical protein